MIIDLEKILKKENELKNNVSEMDNSEIQETIKILCEGIKNKYQGL